MTIMTIYVIIFIAAVLVGMAVSVAVFGTGGKRAKVFRDIYFSIEDVEGIGVLYTKTGEYSAVLAVENPVQKFCANIDSYFEYSSMMAAIMATLGSGYAIHKQDVFTRRSFNADGGNREFLSESYFRYFRGRAYTEGRTYITITQENRKNRLFSFDEKKWKEFMIKLGKVRDQLKDRGVEGTFLSAEKAREYVERFLFQDFTSKTPTFSNFKVGEEQIGIGSRKFKIYSLVDVDSINLPSYIQPYVNIEINNVTMPVDFMTFVDSIPEATSVVFNQVIFLPSQKQELGKLAKKRNRHASLPSPANLIAVEDIKAVEQVIARENKQLVYCHFNLIVTVDSGADLQKCTNHLENVFGRVGVHISQRAYNQLELFVSSFPGNCYSLNPDYDRFLTLSDAASCLMYKEHTTRSEQSSLKVYYTDRQGVPVAIDISGKEGAVKLTDNSNFFCLGPSGSGKSFHMHVIWTKTHLKELQTKLRETS